MKIIAYLSLLMPIGLGASEYGFPDPYPDVYENILVLPLYRHGWYLHEQFKKILSEPQVKTVVEVGVWTGNCTIFLAELLPEDGRVFAVDHWLGSAEHRDPGNRAEYGLLPTLYQQFLSNVIHAKMTHKIIPVRLESLQAARKFKELGVKADVIYIDAAHDYDSVSYDLLAWYPLLSKNGVLCGDDWNLGGPNGEVSRAVKDFANRKDLEIKIDGEFWWYVSPSDD